MMRLSFLSKTSSARSVGSAVALGVVFLGSWGLSDDVRADRQVRGAARTSVNHSGNTSRGANLNANVNRNVNSNANVNRNVNANVNRNVNVNNNVNVNRNVNVYGGGRYDDHYHPVATAAAVGATIAVTSAVIGSMVRTLPPACTATIVNGITYQNCGGAWYQPQYAGSQITYVVVSAPR